MIRQNVVQTVDLQTQDVVEIMQMVQMLRHQVRQTVSATVVRVVSNGRIDFQNVITDEPGDGYKRVIKSGFGRGVGQSVGYVEVS